MTLSKHKLEKREQLKEKLAKFIHEDLWAHWMEHFFNVTYRMKQHHEGIPSMVDVLPQRFGDRWRRQKNMKYEDLPEDEKKSDRELAEKLMKLLEEVQK